jgi:hypothetical protein
MMTADYLDRMAVNIRRRKVFTLKQRLEVKNNLLDQSNKNGLKSCGAS